MKTIDKKPIAIELKYPFFAVLCSIILFLPSPSDRFMMGFLLLNLQVFVTLLLPALIHASKAPENNAKRFIIGGLLSFVVVGFVIFGCAALLITGGWLYSLWFGEIGVAYFKENQWLSIVAAFLVSPFIFILLTLPFSQMLVGAAIGDSYKLREHKKANFHYVNMRVRSAIAFMLFKLFADFCAITGIAFLVAITLYFFGGMSDSVLEEGGLISIIHPAFIVWVPFYTSFLIWGTLFSEYVDDVTWGDLKWWD